jgi:D-alanyl-D-alanine carboxypeptidase (penicillin-binding protein 5/6)
LSELNADARVPTASLTKIMLLVITAEEINAGRLSLTDPVTASAHASSMSGSVIWLEPGEVMSVADLIKSVVISSANDSAVALAEYIAGSEDKFVELMNQKAYALKMTNTRFTNAAGYDNPEHYSSARDVAVMSRALMREENYKFFSDYMLTRLSSVRTGTERETQLLNTNKLITYYKGVEGIKTGTTDNAGYCLSAAATQADRLGNNIRLISVVMGCKDEFGRVDLSEKLLDYGFANFELYSGFTEDLPPFESIPVQNGVDDSVRITGEFPKAIVIPKGRAGDIEYEFYLPERITAPIELNQPVGTVTATLDGETVYEGYISAAQAAQELTFWRIFTKLLEKFLHF